MYNNHKVSSLFENIGSVEALIIKGTGFSDKWPIYAILVHPPYFRLILILIFLHASIRGFSYSSKTYIRLYFCFPSEKFKIAIKWTNQATKVHHFISLVIPKYGHQSLQILW